MGCTTDPLDQKLVELLFALEMRLDEESAGNPTVIREASSLIEEAQKQIVSHAPRKQIKATLRSILELLPDVQRLKQASV